MKFEMDSHALIGLWSALSNATGAKLVDKQSAEEMELIGQFLSSLGVMERSVFMREFATTIARDIYLPFTLADERTRPLINQTITLAHEIQHVIQHNKDGGFRFALNYLSDNASRAGYEAEALTTSCEVHYMLVGRLPETKPLAESLRHYALDMLNIETVKKRLRMAGKTITAGGLITDAGKMVHQFMQASADGVWR